MTILAIIAATVLYLIVGILVNLTKSVVLDDFSARDKEHPYTMGAYMLFWPIILLILLCKMLIKLPTLVILSIQALFEVLGSLFD